MHNSMQLRKIEERSIVSIVLLLILIYAKPVESYNRRGYVGKTRNNSGTMLQTEESGFSTLFSVLYNIYLLIINIMYHIGTIDGICLFFLPNVISIASNMQRTIQVNGSKNTKIKSILHGFTAGLIFFIAGFFGLLLKQPSTLSPYLGVIIGVYSVLGIIAISCLLLTFMDTYRVNPTGQNRELMDNLRAGAYLMRIILFFLAYGLFIFGTPAVAHAAIYGNLIFLSSVFYYIGHCFERENKKFERIPFIYKYGGFLATISGIAGFYLLNTYFADNAWILQNLLGSK